MAFDRWIKSLTLLVAFGGVVTFFYGEYLTDQREIRSRTAAFIDRYRSGDVFDAQMDMIGAWRKIPVRMISDTAPSKIVVDRLIVSIIESNDKLFLNFMILINYFDSLSLCLDIGECDKALARGALQADAARFLELYHGAIVSTRERLLLYSLGRGLDAFVYLSDD